MADLIIIVHCGRPIKRGQFYSSHGGIKSKYFYKWEYFKPPSFLVSQSNAFVAFETRANVDVSNFTGITGNY